jgi:transcriptional regulator with XRE-family HTH domain
MKKTQERAHKNEVGPKIRELRLAAKGNISQEDLAGRLAALGINMDRSAISRVENQERYLMDYELIAFARALKVPPDKLLPEK